MPLLRNLIRVPKAVVKAGKWDVVTGNAKMSPSVFRLATGHAIQLPRHYHWRVDALEGGGHEFKMLTAYYRDKREYLAHLALIRDKDMPVVSRLEFHGTHGGWHCHIADCGIDELESDNPSPRYCRRFPQGDKYRNMDYDMSDLSAQAMSFKFYRVVRLPDSELGL